MCVCVLGSFLVCSYMCVCVAPVFELMISAFLFFFLLLIVPLTIAVNNSPEWLRGSTVGGWGGGTFSKEYMFFLFINLCAMWPAVAFY